MDLLLSCWSKENVVVRKQEIRLQKQAKIRSKGQITVPREVRRLLGVRVGDRLLFESDGKGIRVRLLPTPEKVY
jgi:AbrB family looped-hinge helix DNA binding protein